MQNQNNIFDELSTLFSQERLAGYLRHTDCNNKSDALIAYSWNIELSQALYPALQVLEITLRNSLHRAITTAYKTSYWFDLSFLHPKEMAVVNQAKDSLKRDRKQIEVGRLVAELSFGFWTSLFDVRYEYNQTLWPRLLKPVFQHMPKRYRTRQYLSRELNRIRYLRNRIFHYESIWHWKDLSEQHESLINLVRWLSPLAANYVSVFDCFKDVYSNGKLQVQDGLKKLISTE